MLKTYGDELETGPKSPSPSGTSRKRVIVRGVILLTRLICRYVDRYVPQVQRGFLHCCHLNVSGLCLSLTVADHLLR